MRKRRPTYIIEAFHSISKIDKPDIKKCNLESTCPKTLVEKEPELKASNPKVTNNGLWKGQFRLILKEIERVGKERVTSSKRKQNTSLVIKNDNTVLSRAFEVLNSSFQIKNFNEKKLIQGYSKRKYLQKRDSILSLTDKSNISESLSLAEQLKAQEEEEENDQKLTLTDKLLQTIDAHCSVVSSSLTEANKATGRSRASRLSRISSKRSISSIRSRQSNRSTSGFRDKTNKKKSSKDFRRKRLSLINEGNEKPQVTKIKLENIQLDFKTQKANITKLSPYMLPSSSRTNKLMIENDILPPLSARNRDEEKEKAKKDLADFEKLAYNYQKFNEKMKNNIFDLQNEFSNEINEVEKSLKGLIDSKRLCRTSMLFKRKKAIDELFKEVETFGENNLTVREIRAKTLKLVEFDYNSARQENSWFEEVIKRYFAQVTKFSIIDKKLFLGLQQILKDRIILNKDIFKELLTEIFKDVEIQTPLTSRVTNYIAFHVVDFEEDEFKHFLTKNNVIVPQRIGKVKKNDNALKLAGGIRALSLAMKLKRNLLSSQPNKLNNTKR